MLKEFYKVDDQGKPIDNVLLDIEKDKIPKDHYEAWGDRSFYSPRYDFELSDWVEDIENEVLLQMEKDQKIQELNGECNATILGRFTAVVNEITYSFSNDAEAQSNFEKADRAFEKNRINSISWTAYDSNGDVVRLSLDEDNFEPVYIAHLSHIQGNISKFRDYLQPLVEGAQTVEEIQQITWS